jgi:hypothetical protein
MGEMKDEARKVNWGQIVMNAKPQRLFFSWKRKEVLEQGLCFKRLF